MIFEIVSSIDSYDFLNKQVRSAIKFATPRYPIRAINLAIVEAIKG
jgi:hypothetical protein